MDSTSPARALILLTGAVVFFYLLVTIAWQLVAVAALAALVLRTWWKRAAVQADVVEPVAPAATMEPARARVLQPAL